MRLRKARANNFRLKCKSKIKRSFDWREAEAFRLPQPLSGEHWIYYIPLFITCKHTNNVHVDKLVLARIWLYSTIFYMEDINVRISRTAYNNYSTVALKRRKKLKERVSIKQLIEEASKLVRDIT
jgi:hypothetical protein